MEDLLMREIDRIGEMLQKIARRLGLFSKSLPNYTMSDFKTECGKTDLPFDVEEVLSTDNPILYLVEKHKVSDNALETFIDIVFHSDMDEKRKKELLSDAISYLDNKGYISFKLHSLNSD